MTSTDITKFVRRLCATINAELRGKSAVSIERSVDDVDREPIDPKLLAEMVRDVDDWSGDREREIEDFFKTERDDLVRLFDHIAEHGRISKDDAESVQYWYDEKRNLDWELVKAKDGTQSLQPIFRNHLGLLAFAAKELVAARLPIRVVKCSKCGDLFCAEVGVVGHPPKHCSRKCARAAASAADYNRNKVKRLRAMKKRRKNSKTTKARRKK